MANTLSDVTIAMLAAAQPILRKNTVLARLFNTSTADGVAAQKGDTISVPRVSVGAVQDVTPATTPQANNALTAATTDISLNQHKFNGFTITDKEFSEFTDNGIVPKALTATIASLAHTIDSYILDSIARSGGVYNYVNVAGSTPFAYNVSGSLRDAANASKKLSKALTSEAFTPAPLEGRHIVLGTSAEANAVMIDNLLDASKRDSDITIREASLGRALGFDWHVDQSLDTTLGSSSLSTMVNLATDSSSAANVAVGSNACLLSSGTLDGALLSGSVFSFSNDSEQTYVVTTAADSTVGDDGTVSCSFEPSLQKAITAGTELVNIQTAFTPNIAFQEDAGVFASRPLSGGNLARELGATEETLYDPVSGIAMRMQITRENYQTAVRVDVLYGFQMINPESACWILG